MVQPFLISSFSSGLFQFYEPWLAPKDAFTETQNITIQQGTITTRDGLSPWHSFFHVHAVSSNKPSISTTIPDHSQGSIEIFTPNASYKQLPNGQFYQTQGSESLTISQQGNQISISFPSTQQRDIFISFSPSTTSPIRAIAHFETHDPHSLGSLIFSDTNLCCFLNGERYHKLFIKQPLHTHNNSTTAPTPFFFNPNSLAVTAIVNGQKFQSFYSQGFLPSGPITKASWLNNTINVTLNKPLGTNDQLYYSAIPTQIFSNSNSSIAWDSSREFIAFTNNKDPIGFFNTQNFTISRPELPISSQALSPRVSQIQTAKTLKFFKNRLLLFAPTITNTNSPQDGLWAQSIRWSAPFLNQNSEFSYWNFIADQPGFGGEFSPDTNEEIIGCGNVKDKLVLWFSNSSYSMAPTQSSQQPFSIYKINSSLYASCTHSISNTDSHTQILGQYGYIQSDGNNSERFDINIINVIKNINFDLHFKISALALFYESQYILLLYPTKSPPSQEPNAAILYNLLDHSFTTLDFSSINLSALGLARSSSKTTWGETRKTLLINATLPFYSYKHYTATQYPIAGSTDGHLYSFSPAPQDLNASSQSHSHVLWYFKTSRFSPFIEKGLAFSMPFIDIYFEGQGTPLLIIIDIFINGRSSPAKSLNVSLHADLGTQTFKRIHTQIYAFFSQFTFRLNPNSTHYTKLKLLGIILWAEEAGEIKDCKYLK